MPSPDSLRRDVYDTWLSSLKSRVTAARTRAALAVNTEAIRLYHEIGTELLARRHEHGWGAKVVTRLARDLREAFPDMKGFSTSNLKYMAQFAEAYPALSFGQQPAGQFVQQAAAQLPWFHIVLLLSKVKSPAERDWYAARAASEAWSRATLDANIRDRLHLRTGAAVTNFPARLPDGEHAALAVQTLKDPYLFDFLGLGNEAHELAIEHALVRHITGSFWNSAKGSRSSVAKCASRSAATSSSLIYSSTTRACAAMSWWN